MGFAGSGGMLRGFAVTIGFVLESVERSRASSAISAGFGYLFEGLSVGLGLGWVYRL